MFAIIGATGNVGRATCAALREAGSPVRAIVRDEARSAELREAGCEIAQVDLQDGPALAQALLRADAVQVIAPLRPQTADPAGDLRRSIDSIVAALAQARPKRVLVISDYGAHVERDIGMPSIFHAFEARLGDLGGQVVILRSAEHMHNWGRGIPAALASGTLASFQDPIGVAQPTIAARDLGRIAAELLRRPDEGGGVRIVHAEGPQRYSASDVAAALSTLSGRNVVARAVPRADWQGAFARVPASLADLLIKANDAKNAGGLVDIEPGVGEIHHGTTTMLDALKPLMPPA